MGNENRNTHVDALGSEISKLRWYGPYGRCPVVVFEKSPDPNCKGYVERVISSPDGKPLFEPPELPYPLKRLTFSGIDFAEKQTCGHRDTIKSRIEAEEKRCYVGYDVEYVQPDKNELKASLISHQFYFAHYGKRKCVIILTNERFTERDFLEIIAKSTPDTAKSVYLAAHFSLAEAGWLVESFYNQKDYLNNLKFLDACHANPWECYYAIAEIALIKSLIVSIYTNNKRKTDISFSPEDSFVECCHNLEAREYSWIDKKIIDKLLECKTDYEAFNLICARKLELFKVSKYTEDLFKLITYPKLPLVPKRDKTWHGIMRLPTRKEKQDYRLRTISTLQNNIKTVFNAYLDLQLCILISSKTEIIPGQKNKKSVTLDAVKNGYFNCLLKIHQARTEIKPNISPDSLIRQLLNLNISGKKISHKGFGKSSPAILNTRTLYYVDTMGLHASSLSSLGEIIGIEKIKIEQCRYSEMDKFLEEDPYTFCHYAIRDSVVCAEAVAWFARLFRMELGLPIKTRITAYSSAHFQKVLKNTVYNDLIEEAKNRTKTKQDAQDALDKANGVKRKTNVEHDLGENLKLYLGWTKKRGKWEPSLRMQQFARFYAGGWNAVFKPGSRGPCNYADLKSAYPCAFMLLKHDYNFSKHKIFRGDNAQAEAVKMIDGGPFQIAGLEIMFKFRDFVEREGVKVPVEPMFPVRIHKSETSPLQTYEGQEMILYSKVGMTNVMFPEFYTAYKLDLLEDYTITVLETFEPLEGPSKFADEMYNILERRGRPGMKAIYKSVANYLYGKYAESVKKKTVRAAGGLGEKRRRPGSLTCFPMAAYATSVCRSAMAELLNLGNECFAITTDGFVTSVMDLDQLKRGDIINMTQAKLGQLIDRTTGKPYQFVETAYTADKSLFIKTRGYVLDGKDEKGKRAVKLARMGVQTRRDEDDDDTETKASVLEFLEILEKTKFTKFSFQNFQKLKKDGQNLPPLQTCSSSSVSHTFDMKRIPCEPVTLSKFEYGDTVFEYPLFDTKPLYATSDFVLVRKLSKRNSTEQNYKDLIRNIGCEDYNLFDEIVDRQADSDDAEPFDEEMTELEKVYQDDLSDDDEDEEYAEHIEEIKKISRTRF